MFNFNSLLQSAIRKTPAISHAKKKKKKEGRKEKKERKKSEKGNFMENSLRNLSSAASSGILQTLSLVERKDTVTALS